jgi:predicted DNA-binding ArsR family transcriptional regulator
MPLSTRKSRNRKVQYKIDTDTSNSLYAVNAFGTLEKINRVNTNGHKPEVEN